MASLFTTKELTKMANLLWEYNNQAIKTSVVIDPLQQLEESAEYTISVKHDSSKPITECGFYLTPYSGNYTGTHSPQKDLERVLWLANNYPGYGLSIRQEYVASGEIDSYGTIRLIDLSRPENIDIFSGETIEITSGPENGNTQLINSYDPLRKLFILNGSFFYDVTGDSYRILIDQEKFFKTGQGSSFSYPIPLVTNGGIINRFETITFKLKMRIPKFAMSAGSFLFDLNMRFTSLDEIQ